MNARRKRTESRSAYGKSLLLMALSYLLAGAATGSFADAGRRDLYINEIMANNQTCCPDDEGEFPDWIEIYNAGKERVDLTGMYITDDIDNPTRFRIAADSPTTATIAPGGFLLLWADGDLDDGPAHVDFGLRRSGEELALFAPDASTLIDSLSFGPQQADVSYGRQPDGGDDWFSMEAPSPGRPNATTGKSALSDPPLFSHLGGMYEGNVAVALFHPAARTLITYTTDGAIPTRRSTPYWDHPLELRATTVVRARAFTAGRTASEVITHTFLIGEQPTLPVVSLATDPHNLWDEDLGIYVEGKDENFKKNWERPASIEFFEADGELGFTSDVGVEIHGGWSRRLPQKSLAINFRAKYGTETLTYRLFADKPIEEFKEFILRNSGNDWTYTLMRDGMMQSLVKDRMDLDYQSYRPAILFLNGQYWGIHNLRERINASYIASNYGIPRNQIDLLEERSEVRVGTAAHYDSLLAFLDASDMAAPETMEHVENQMQIDHYIDYQIAEIFFANTDWPATNIEYWRPRTDAGKWRWILFDTDFGFDLKLALTPSPPDHNTLEMASTADGPPYPNPPWSTFLLRTLLEAPEFRNQFVQQMAIHLNTTFATARVIALIDSLRDEVGGEIARHAERWSPHPAPHYGDPFSSVETWEANIAEMREFARQRGGHVRQHLAAKFGLESQSLLSLRVEPEHAGVIEINGVRAEPFPWSGPLFDEVPFQLTARANFGYEFAGWSAPFGADESIAVALSEALSLTAHFAPGGMPAVLINEINYNSSSDFDAGDWVELHNPGDAAVDISGWTFGRGRKNNGFLLPPETMLPAGGFAVLCQERSAMTAAFADLDECIGDFAFNIDGGGDIITLSDSLGQLVDAVAFDDAPPWPQTPDGTGPTLALRNASLDNARAEHWDGGADRGTPGAPNKFGERKPGVEIAAFEATGAAGAILLNWTAVYEIGNQGFNIYRRAESEHAPTLAGSFRREKSALKGRMRSTRSKRYVWADDGVDPEVDYTYVLAHVTTSGEEVRHRDSAVSARATRGIEAGTLVISTYPNPFNDAITIVFQPPETALVSVAVYNILGAKVATLIEDERLTAMPHTLTWNGSDGAGGRVASGVYLCRIRAGEATRTAKILLLR